MKTQFLITLMCGSLLGLSNAYALTLVNNSSKKVEFNLTKSAHGACTNFSERPGEEVPSVHEEYFLYAKKENGLTPSITISNKDPQILGLRQEEVCVRHVQGDVILRSFSLEFNSTKKIESDNCEIFINENNEMILGAGCEIAEKD